MGSPKKPNIKALCRGLMQVSGNLLHTISVCTSILSGFVGVVATLWKLANNHFAHIKQDIIQNSNDNANKIVGAVKDSTIAIVSALKRE